ncbi:MAG TPA: hypothetical protein VGD45_16860 [Steroidobacter sp.]|uniref:Tse2 family ADP-ribosyltransferase toxin n=1 Tax=Steroidobacter sp. TaxID=1978227 RepID=UPI002ED8E187
MGSEAKFPVPGTVLWAVDVELEREVFRSGASGKPNVDYLRWIDIGVDDKEGRIPEEELEIGLKPGQGISLFLERMIPEGMVVMDAASWKKLDKYKRKEVHWWGIDQGHPLPSGLSLVYDGKPPGHCTLTITRPMAIKSFLSLVALIPFSKKGKEFYGATH